MAGHLLFDAQLDAVGTGENPPWEARRPVPVPVLADAVPEGPRCPRCKGAALRLSGRLYCRKGCAVR